MNYTEQLQTLSKEDATKLIHDVLNARAMDALDAMQSVAEGIDSGLITKKKPIAPTASEVAAQKIIAARKKAQADQLAVTKVKEGVEDELSEASVSEAVKKVGEFSAGRHTAKTYKDSDLGEYKTKFFCDGKHHEPADHFTDNKDDALGTAKSEVTRMHAKDQEGAK